MTAYRFRIRPTFVVLPANTAEVAQAVKLARALGMPIVPRGAGASLGRALPTDGCLMTGLSEMTKILEVDLPNRRMRVEPGVINLDISRYLASLGYYDAPDPASQSYTIGDNAAESLAARIASNTA